jgi:pimeloyl-ACP methyl ester carboxylesterase
MLTTTPGYAPFPLQTDAASLGFVATVMHGGVGLDTRRASPDPRPVGAVKIVARHRPERTSTRATIFLHGAAGSWTTWTPLLAAAEEAGITIVNPVLFDLPGWGDATPEPGAEPLTLEIVCELVKDMALELGYTEWDIVGHSLGGFIALHMASIWPQSVHSVSLVSGTTWSVIESVAHPWKGLRVIPGFVLLRFFMRLLAPIQPVALAAVRGLRAIGVLRLASFPLFRHLSRVDETVVRALATELRPRSFVTAGDVTRGYDADRQWGRIECQVHATKGDEDVFVTDADLQRLTRVVRRVTTTVIADCGHFGNVEQPAATLAALDF